ncbi:SMI1/KNR4 family protein [Catellatospora paridis]|uniref:SMI1/KNR4 family protein n=1 Tax=Catellatospora paridis TaxID=1617086 RepID=UPI0012D4229D|nr:SMI1/KNR4 family protein [Catellatospora paridis]
MSEADAHPRLAGMTEDELLDRMRARLAESRSWAGPARLATPAEIAESEQLIGFAMPPLLRRIYLEVANGGFGPRDSVLGVGDGAWTDDDADIIAMYQGFSGRPGGHPPGVVPLYDVGCAILWMVDFRDPAGPMWGWDPHGCCLDHVLAPQGLTLAEWLVEAHDGRDARRIEPQWVCKPKPVWPPERRPRRVPRADDIAPAGPPAVAAPLTRRTTQRQWPPAHVPPRPALGRDPRRGGR